MVLDGEFGAMMQVHIQNDGPVTIELASPASTDPRLVCLILAVIYITYEEIQSELFTTNHVALFRFAPF